MRWNKIITIMIVMYSSVVESSAYIPNNNFVVFETPKTNLVNTYRNKINNNKGNITILVESITTLLEQAKSNNSELLFGKIESLLINNLETVNKSDKLKTLYADVLQRRHAFDSALKYLENVELPKSNLMRSTLYQNLGEFAKASIECRKLIGKINIFVATTCITHARSYQGKLQSSFSSLKGLNESISESDRSTKIWSLTALAEMASRAGESDLSLKYYLQANRLEPNNAHIMSEWVDVLYNFNEDTQIVSLLEGNKSEIRLKLRYLRSQYKLGNYQTIVNEKLKRELSNAISLLELRKDKRHYDTRAEYYIWIKPDAEKSLYWARQNWAVSETPVAAKLLLRAAKLGINMDAANEINEWIRKTKVEDNELDKMVVNMINGEMII